ncbi:MAG: hypothetical protein ACTSQO_02860 [Candidatus Helarchaeota archaeon]
MDKEKFKIWIKEIKRKTPIFLKNMQGNQRQGFFKYSLSGDIFREHIKWGLGNAVFALKIYYTINYNPKNLNKIAEFIISFQKKNGEFYDPIVKYLSFPLRVFYSLRYNDFNNLNNQQTIRAETRQAFSALNLFRFKPKYQYLQFPKTEESIKNYLKSLNWNKPWGAASHFSHLLFFLSHSNIINKLKLIDFAVNLVNKLQHDDGCWYSGNPPLDQKINGSMKIITGLKVATSIADYNNGEIYFDKAMNLIDTVLKATNDIHACDNFNITFVLKYANEITKNYRYNEIEKFFKNRLNIYMKYYYPKYGAFSFYPQRAKKSYYDALISKGKREPDIHGTSLFLWGLSIIGDFWNLNETLKINEYIS